MAKTAMERMVATIVVSFILNRVYANILKGYRTGFVGSPGDKGMCKSWRVGRKRNKDTWVLRLMWFSLDRTSRVLYIAQTLTWTVVPLCVMTELKPGVRVPEDLEAA